MKKLLFIALKDLRITFSDTAALIWMLATPFVLTLAISFAFGGSGSAGIEAVPVALVNHDEGLFGEVLVQVFQSEDLADLVAPAVLTDEAAARRTVDSDERAAAVIIPAGFSAAIFPEEGSTSSDAPAASVEIYANPTRPVSASVIRSITESVLNQLNASFAAGRTAVEGLIATGRITPQQAAELGPVVGRRAGEQVFDSQLITVREQAGASGLTDPADFDWTAYMAPSMAILFLMFTVTASSRTILTEREGGTLPRILSTPTRAGQVMGGKILGIFLIGVLQLTILAVTSRILLGLHWGDPMAVAALIAAVVFGATGWGLLLAAYARTPGQVSVTGSALALIFGAAAGNFVPRNAMPDWLRMVSYVSPNAWGLEGFAELISGGTLTDVLPAILALVVMGVALFLLALVLFRRQLT